MTIVEMNGEGPARVDARHHTALVAACRALHAADGPVPLAALAARAGLSGSHFQRLFRSRLGVTPRQYASHLQRERAQAALGHAPRITDALFEAGFETPSRFYERARGMLGMSPSAWRDGGRGVAIDHAVVDTVLGPLLVAATESGVCRVAFDAGASAGASAGADAGASTGTGEDAVVDPSDEMSGDAPLGRQASSPAAERDALVAALVARFPNATLGGGGARFRETVDAVAALVSEASVARRTRVDIPLDVEGTLFQSQVWRVLQGIPAGRTMTYAEVAGALGRPSAHRAVANACGANPVALLIPCHRVVRRGGGLGGYRWGVARKRALLAGERKALASSP